MPAVGLVLLSVLFFLVLPFLLYLVFFFSSAPLSLSLSASASGKSDNLIAWIWGGHLLYRAKLNRQSQQRGTLGYML